MYCLLAEGKKDNLRKKLQKIILLHPDIRTHFEVLVLQ